MYNRYYRRNGINMEKRHSIDLQKEFENEKYFSLKKVKLAVKQMEREPSILTDALKMMFNPNPLKSMRASWLVLHISFVYPELVLPHLKQLIKFLNQTNLHTGAIRNTIRVFQELDLPEKYCGPIFDLCMGYAKNATLPLAVRAFSINTLGNICKKYPELKHEVELVLNELKEFPQAPSLNASIKSVSKILLKL